MTMITPSYLGETIEYSSLHACRSTLEDPTQNRLEALCFSPLSFKLRSPVRLPQGLPRVPHHQHDAKAYDRTDHSEHKAIICMLGIHICVCPSYAPNCRTIRPTSEAS